MNRTLIAVTAAATLIATNLLAAETAGPLAPGQAAGVKKAQDASDAGLWWLIGGGVGLGAIILATTGGNGTMPSAATPTATSTST